MSKLRVVPREPQAVGEKMMSDSNIGIGGVSGNGWRGTGMEDGERREVVRARGVGIDVGW